MPPLEDLDRTDKAVLWPKVGDSNQGEPLIGDPIELNVRWNGKRRQKVDAQGNVIAIDATIVVDRRIKEGSIMWHGELIDWPGTGLGANDEELMQVFASDETKDLKGRNSSYTADLIRFRHALPAFGI